MRASTSSQVTPIASGRISTPGPVQRRDHLVRPLLVEHGAQHDAQPDRLTMDEVAAGALLEVVEQEVVHALDVARVPARGVERRCRPSDGPP